MARLITVDKIPEEPKSKFCEELEAGNILFFPKCPFEFPQPELDFLLAQKQTGASNRKNIAYKPQQDKITNFVKSSDSQHDQLLNIMRQFSMRSSHFLTHLLNPYSSKWRLDYASFRPFQEKGRQLRTRARNDLLHVDSFPSRPMHGSRILRFFININPAQSRYWTTSDPFGDLAATFGDKGVSFPKPYNAIERVLKQCGQKIGLPVILRSPYDNFMLNLHNYLKENDEFQKNCRKDFWEFPPGSCWAVYTDQVSHAATAGQYALEQTIIIPKNALIHPAQSPVGILEKLTGQPMIEKTFAGHTSCSGETC